MPEMRLNLITKEWVIIAAEKGKKPEDFIKASGKKRLPEYSKDCPFCPGNEAKSPNELYKVHGEEGWKVRVVLNKFSVLSKDGERSRRNEGLKTSLNGVGLHELVVDSPLHNHTIAAMPAEQMNNLIQTYKERFSEMYNDNRIEHVIIFKNSGDTAGTAIEHAISQIVGLPITPPQVRYRLDNSIRYFDETGECLICRTIKDELNDGGRIISNSEHFLSFVPYAAMSPFHIWIFPKRHSGCFADIRPEEAWDLAVTLKTIMSKLHHGLENPDYNYIIKSMKPSFTKSGFVHWYLTIVPRVSLTTGFELGSGMRINPIQPEKSAEFLRNVKVPEKR